MKNNIVKSGQLYTNSEKSEGFFFEACFIRYISIIQ